MAKYLSPEQMNSHLVGDNINQRVARYMKIYNLHAHKKLEAAQKLISNEAKLWRKALQWFKVQEGPMQLFVILASVITVGITFWLINHYFELPWWVNAIFIFSMKILAFGAKGIPFLKLLLSKALWGKIAFGAVKSLVIGWQVIKRFCYTATFAKFRRWNTAYTLGIRGLRVNSFNKEVYFNKTSPSPLMVLASITLTVLSVVFAALLAPSFVGILGKIIHIPLENTTETLAGMASIIVSFFVLLWFFTWLPEMLLHSKQKQAIRFSFLRYFVNGQRGFLLHHVGSLVVSAFGFVKKDNRIRFRPFSLKFWKETGLAGYHGLFTVSLNPEKYGVLVALTAETWKEKLLSPFKQLVHIAPVQEPTDDLNQDLTFHIPANTRYVLVPNAELKEVDIVGPDYKKVAVVEFESDELTMKVNASVTRDTSLGFFKSLPTTRIHAQWPLATFKNIHRTYRWTFIFENE